MVCQEQNIAAFDGYILHIVCQGSIWEPFLTPRVLFSSFYSVANTRIVVASVNEDNSFACCLKSLKNKNPKSKSHALFITITLSCFILQMYYFSYVYGKDFLLQTLRFVDVLCCLTMNMLDEVKHVTSHLLVDPFLLYNLLLLL